MRRGSRMLAWSLWPLGLALQLSVVIVAGWSNPDSMSRTMGATTVAFLVALLGGSVAQLTFLSGVPAALSRLGFPGALGLWPVSSPSLVQTVAVVVLGDLLEYWYHRLAHTLPWLWRAHAIHHTPIRLNALKGPGIT